VDFFRVELILLVDGDGERLWMRKGLTALEGRPYQGLSQEKAMAKGMRSQGG